MAAGAAEDMSLSGALSRARVPILSFGLTYSVFVAVGIFMVHSGNQFALSFRDNLVARARQKDPAAIAYDEGRPVRAALLDFTRNLLLGAVPQTVGGLAIVLPYPVAAYRGWVGGIVSVGSHRRSRLSSVRSAAYYLLTLLLQLVPYSLSGGAGVHLGLAYLRARSQPPSEKWLGFPKLVLQDVGRIYSAIVPLFLLASLWEFLSPWN